MTHQSENPTRPRRMQGWNRASEEGNPPAGDTAATTSSSAESEPAVATPRRRRMGSSQPQASTAMKIAEQPDHQAPVAERTPDQSRAATNRTQRRRMGGTASAQPEALPVTTAAKQSSPATAESSAAAVPPSPGDESRAKAVTSRPAWVKPLLITTALLVGAVVVVMLSRWLRTLEPIQAFIATYSGHTELPEKAPVGLPAWIGWQHFFNMFFMVLIVRTGWQVRTERKPAGYWTPKKNSFFAPKGSTPKKVSLTQWLHQSLDVLWMVNGLIFVVLLFGTGQWMRIVPTSWDIFPHMASTALQYASLDWPLENGWVHYNALQVMAYFITVFIAAPLAILSGIRLSTWWPDKNAKLNKLYPVEVARAIHFPVMLYFVAFTVVHVFLVFFTGALRNLNHMYTSRDVVDAWGLVILLISLVVIAAGWFLTRPEFIAPIASKTGKISK